MAPRRQPIPQDLTEAFRDAVAYYPDWSPALDEARISIDRKAYTVSAVCSLVDGFRDRVPNDVRDSLLSYFDGAEKLEFAEDPSYAMAGYCLRILIERRLLEYQKLEANRRNP
jgi:hypothetical protein